jgi:hypothetical protein
MRELGITSVMESITLVMFILLLKNICLILLEERRLRNLFTSVPSIETQLDHLSFNYINHHNIQYNHHIIEILLSYYNNIITLKNVINIIVIIKIFIII